MNILFIIFLILAIVIALAFLIEKSSHVKFSVTMNPIKTVYNEQMHRYEEKPFDTSNGRVIDGHPLRTQEDWARWSVYEKKARDVSNRIMDCEKALRSPFCENPQEVADQAQSLYKEFESLCSTYGMWNWLINDYEVYIPTARQRCDSFDFLRSITSLVPDAIEKRDLSFRAEQVVNEYLQSCPRHTGYRADIVRLLSSEMDCTPSDSAKMLRVLYKRNLFIESKKQQGRIVVRKRIEKKTNQGGKSAELGNMIESPNPNRKKVNLSKTDFSSIDDLVQALNTRQITFADNRSKGGCLWIKSTLENDPFLLSVTVAGTHLTFVDSVRRFDNYGAYYIKP